MNLRTVYKYQMLPQGDEEQEVVAIKCVNSKPQNI